VVIRILNPLVFLSRVSFKKMSSNARPSYPTSTLPTLHPLNFLSLLQYSVRSKETFLICHIRDIGLALVLHKNIYKVLLDNYNYRTRSKVRRLMVSYKGIFRARAATSILQIATKKDFFLS
jgi:hypothetical protein